MKTQLFTLANAEQYNAAKKDVIGTITSNLEKLFNMSISVELEKLESGAVRIKFMYPFENTQLLNHYITLPSDVVAGLIKEENK